MILKPRLQDIKNIGYNFGKIIIYLGVIMLIPAAIGFSSAETDPTLDFMIAAEISFIFGLVLTRLCLGRNSLNWIQGIAVFVVSWCMAVALGAIPLYLSGHWKSYLDACFDSMPWRLIKGVALVQDLNHLSFSHGFWRHIINFSGGQIILIVVLFYFVTHRFGHIGAKEGPATE